MKSTDLSKTPLREAAGQVREAFLKSEAACRSDKPDYSPEFKANMAKLLEKHRKKVLLHKTLQRVAAACLAVILSAALWLTFDIEARAAVLDWAQALPIFNLWVITGDELNTEDPLPYYVPGWLPEAGYEEVSRQWEENGCTVVYQKGDDLQSAFQYYYYRSGNLNQGPQPGEGYTSQSLDCGLFTATLYASDDPTDCKNLIWLSEDAYDFAFSMSFYFDTETAANIAKSIYYDIPVDSYIRIRTPRYTPEGYTGMYGYRWNENEYSQEYLLLGENRDHYYFAYWKPGYSSTFSPPREGSAYTWQEVTVQGKPARLYFTENNSLPKYLSWSDGEYEYSIWHYFDSDIAIRIANSVQ